MDIEISTPRPGLREGGESVDPRRWVALSVLLLAACMDLLDVSIVNVAIPAIQHGLKASYAAVEWVVAGYTLAFAVGLITGGRLGDIFGRKRVFIIGTAAFTIASALCGVAQDPGMLIASRVIQGAAAAVMVPQVLSIIQVSFPAKERPAALGTYGAAVGLATISGPVLGGLLLRADVLNMSWRPIFLVNVVIGLIAVPAALAMVRESKATSAPRLDVGGVVIVSLMLVALVYPLVQGRDLGWPTWTFVLMACSLPLLVVFLRYEKRVAQRGGSPLVILSLFRRRAFVAGSAVTFTFMLGLASFYLIITLYLQLGMGFTALHSGLTTVPSSLGFAAAAGAAAKLAPKYGRRLLSPGSMIAAGGMGWMIAAINGHATSVSSWQLAGPMFVFGMGMGILVPSLVDASLTDVPHEHAGSASGLVNTTLQLGGAVGVALIGVLFFGLLGSRADHSAAAVTPQLRASLSAAHVPSSAQDPIVSGFERCFHDRSTATDITATPASCRAAQPNQQVAQVMTDAGKQAAARDFRTAIAVSLWFQIGAFVLAGLLVLGLPDRIAARE